MLNTPKKWENTIGILQTSGKWDVIIMREYLSNGLVFTGEKVAQGFNKRAEAVEWANSHGLKIIK